MLLIFTSPSVFPSRRDDSPKNVINRMLQHTASSSINLKSCKDDTDGGVLMLISCSKKVSSLAGLAIDRQSP
ncbi:MAG: hypothetical protein LBF88_01770 [Planctomycetaceae bacterium]|nr:hypothetical protein [Planctomycetaceae bacterium]